MQSVKTVPCPRCGNPVRFVPENKWRPFCSERCKMIDLGAWGSERYRMPENPGKGSVPQAEPEPGDEPPEH